MTEDGTSNTAWGRRTRRGFLALAGSGILAGCTGLPALNGGSEPTIRVSDLPDLDPDADPDPAVAESVPVGIAPAHFQSARDRVTTLLAELPTPLGPEDIPNGHIRQRLSTAAGNATNALDDARDASTEFAALSSLRRARSEARYAATGWAVADQGLSVDPLKREYSQAVADARAMREEHEYVGSDPVRAALVHSRIEDGLERVIEDRGPTTGDAHLLHVAQWGETAESVRARLADARHLDEQFVASLPADAGTVEGTLTAAAETVLADVRSRQSALPPAPTAEDRGVPERAIGDLRRDADDGITRIDDAKGPASAVIEANRRLTQFRALDRLQERLDAGELSRPESAGAVRESRSAAYDALTGVLDTGPYPELSRTAVTDVAWRVVGADRRLARLSGEITAPRLDGVVAEYAIATAVGRPQESPNGRSKHCNGHRPRRPSRPFARLESPSDRWCRQRGCLRLSPPQPHRLV